EVSRAMERCGRRDDHEHRHEIRECHADVRVGPLRSIPTAISTPLHDRTLLEELHVGGHRGADKTDEQEDVLGAPRAAFRGRVALRERLSTFARVLPARAVFRRRRAGNTSLAQKRMNASCSGPTWCKQTWVYPVCSAFLIASTNRSGSGPHT